MSSGKSSYLRSVAYRASASAMETWLFPATEDRRSVISCARAGRCRRTCYQAGRGYLSEEAAPHAGEPSRSLHIVEFTTPSPTDIAKPSLAETRLAILHLQ